MTNVKKHNTNMLPTDEQPYEICRMYGPGRLTDAELLAVILKCGVAGMNSIELSREILNLSNVNGIVGLERLTFEQLTELRGVGPVKAIQVLCIVELAKRFSKGQARSLLSADNSSTVASYYMEELRHLDNEHLMVVLLDTKNHIIGNKVITIGTANSAVISPREVYIEALNHRAVKIILLHNHPSGDPTPSREDLEVTARINEAGRILGVMLLDHIIIGDNRYISLRDEKLI